MELCVRVQLYLNILRVHDCGLRGFSVKGISQARVLEWVAISFSRGIFLTQRLNLHFCIPCQCRVFTAEPPLSGLIRRDKRNCLPPARHKRKAGRGLSPDLTWVTPWTWTSQPPELWEHVCCWSHPVYGILIRAAPTNEDRYSSERWELLRINPVCQVVWCLQKKSNIQVFIWNLII